MTYDQYMVIKKDRQITTHMKDIVQQSMDSLEKIIASNQQKMIVRVIIPSHLIKRSNEEKSLLKYSMEINSENQFIYQSKLLFLTNFKELTDDSSLIGLIRKDFFPILKNRIFRNVKIVKKQPSQIMIKIE